MLNIYASSCQSSKKSTPNWRLSYSKTWCCWWCAVYKLCKHCTGFRVFWSQMWAVVVRWLQCTSNGKLINGTQEQKTQYFETESQGLYSNSDLSLVLCTTPLALYPCMQAFACFSMLHGEKSGKAWLIWWCNADVLDTVLDAIWNLRPLSHALISARVHHATCTCLCPKKWIIAKENKWRVVPTLSTI